MKFKLISTILIFTIITSTCLAQDNTQVGLPEGAIARLGKGGINSMKFSQDGKHLAVATEMGVWLYDVTSGKGILLHTKQPDDITAILFSSDAKILVCASRKNQTIQFWDLSKEKKGLYLTLYDRFVQVIDLVFADDDKTLYSISEYGYLTKWDLNLKKEISSVQFGGNQSTAVFANDGKTFVHLEPKDSSIKIREIVEEIFSEDAIDNTNPKTINAALKDSEIHNGLTVLGISPDNSIIVSAHEDNILRLWDTNTKTLRHSLKGHTKTIKFAAFSPDNEILATGSDDNTIKLWNIEKGTMSKTLSGHTNIIKTIEFSPTNMHLLASSSSDGTIRFWDTQIFTKGHIDSIHDLAFSNDNTVLSTASSDGAIQVWDINKGKTLPTPFVESLDINFALALSHDATILAYNGKVINSSSRGPNNDLSYNQTDIYQIVHYINVYQCFIGICS